MVNILNKCLRILIDCSQLSKTYYKVLFGSFTRDCHARRIYLQTFALQWTKITRKARDAAEYMELLGSFTRIVMHDDAYIGRRSENNIKCVVHDDLG